MPTTNNDYLLILPNYQKKIKLKSTFSQIIFVDCYTELDNIDNLSITILGDLDSCHSLPPEIATIHNQSQDTTDLEKALLSICSTECGIIQVLSPSAGRIDHFLYNIELLHKFSHLNIFIQTELELIFLAKNHLSIRSQKHRKISLFSPFSTTQIHSFSHLAYPLQSELKFGELSSQSNELMPPGVDMSFSGEILVVLEHSDDEFLLENSILYI